MTEIIKIETKILSLRGKQVIIDADLATLYEVETKILKKAVRRNRERFPDDFMFELTQEEEENLRSQNGTSSHGGKRYVSFAFTQEGIAMLSGILRSEKAIKVNIDIMRAFVRLREYVLNYQDISIKFKELEKKYDRQFDVVFRAIDTLLNPIKRKKGQIGFKKVESDK